MRDLSLEWDDANKQRAVAAARRGLETSPCVRVPQTSEIAAAGVAEALRAAGLNAQVKPWLGGYSVVEVTQRFTPKRALPKSGRLMR